jgi:hypothetical protein
MRAVTKTRPLFPVTDWRAVKAAAAPDSSACAEALQSLLQRYLPVLKQYMVTKFDLQQSEVDDLLQDFVLEKILNQDLLRRVDEARGRFRIFLVSALSNYVISELRRAKARKRAPNQARVSLDAISEKDLDGLGAHARRELDFVFARNLFEEALRRMRAECAGSGRAGLWAVFHGRVLRPLQQDLDPVPLEQLKKDCALKTSAKVSNTLATAKRMFARIFRQVVSEYAFDENDVDNEIRDLKEILAQG